MKTQSLNTVFIDSNKKTKAQLREFLQKEFASPKYFSNPNTNLFPMTKYYQEFQAFLSEQITSLEQQKQVEISTQQREKISQAVTTLWLYDLRKIASDQKYYPQIITNVFRAISQDKPVELIQFTCTKRNKSTDLSNFVQTEIEGSNLLPNLPFLQLITADFESKNIPLSIKVILADSENYWVDLQQGKGLENINLREILKPQWRKYQANLQQEIELINGQNNLLELIPTSTLEEKMKIENDFDFETKFVDLKENIAQKFDLKIIARMALVRQSVLQGNQRNAFADAENQLASLNFGNLNKLEDLQALVSEKYIDITLRKLAEYALQGKMLEIIYPQAILLQNERPVEEKNYFYNIDLSLRKFILPEICPYFYQ